MPSGGYRRPNNPAPVSGPGKASRRTDGFGMPNNEQAPMDVTGLPYGENQEVNDVAASAPLAAAPPAPKATPLTAPTQRPDEPITSGIPMGPGANSLSTPSQRPDDPVAAQIRLAYQAAPTPELRAMVNRLEAEGR